MNPDVMFFFVAAATIISFISMVLGGSFIIAWIAYHLIEIISGLSTFGECLLYYAEDPEGRYRAMQHVRQAKKRGTE